MQNSVADRLRTLSICEGGVELLEEAADLIEFLEAELSVKYGLIEQAIVEDLLSNKGQHQ